MYQLYDATPTPARDFILRDVILDKCCSYSHVSLPQVHDYIFVVLRHYMGKKIWIPLRTILQ